MLPDDRRRRGAGCRDPRLRSDPRAHADNPRWVAQAPNHQSGHHGMGRTAIRDHAPLRSRAARPQHQLRVDRRRRLERRLDLCPNRDRLAVHDVRPRPRRRGERAGIARTDAAWPDRPDARARKRARHRSMHLVGAPVSPIPARSHPPVADSTNTLQSALDDQDMLDLTVTV